MTSGNLFRDLDARGIIKQVTDPELSSILSHEKLTLYCGFDPTSESLHIGSLLPLITLRRFQLDGHRPIAVIGGATGMIGDPSEKTLERTLLTPEEIAKNFLGIEKSISQILEKTGSNAVLVVDNANWFKKISFLDFLRDVGRHFTVNYMVAKESIRARLEDREHGISFTEFSYMLLQAYDFLVLNQRENCRLQIGGSDQWGNITAGIELIRKMGVRRTVFGLTHPLIYKADGIKFGKTESGNVWLDAKKTSPYQFYQFFIQTADADVISYLHYFTLLSIEEIADLKKSLEKEAGQRKAQLTLAREVTRLVHGETELHRAERASQALFEESIRELDAKSLLDVLKGAPSTQKDKTLLNGKGLPLVEVLVETGLCPSKGIARKEILAGGIYINNERTLDPTTLLKPEAIIAGNYIVLRKGKRTYHLLVFLF